MVASNYPQIVTVQHDLICKKTSNKNKSQQNKNKTKEHDLVCNWRKKIKNQIKTKVRNVNKIEIKQKKWLLGPYACSSDLAR